MAKPKETVYRQNKKQKGCFGTIFIAPDTKLARIERTKIIARVQKNAQKQFSWITYVRKQPEKARKMNKMGVRKSGGGRREAK